MDRIELAQDKDRWWAQDRSCEQPVNITHDYKNCCLYWFHPPDDEQQACSKHVEACYWNKLIENSSSCWFMLYTQIIHLCSLGVLSFVLLVILSLHTDNTCLCAWMQR
jgi:hypothetical protein